MAEAFVAIMMGSESDLPVMRSSMGILEQFSIPYEVRITSAHRTPKYTQEYVCDAEVRGCKVFIAAAGMAAHLAGAVAAQTIKPVIGVPIDAGSLQGIDALLSTVQMPGGIPVACVAIGKAGAKNAAYLALQIMAVENEKLSADLSAERSDNATKIRLSNQAVNKNLEKK